MIQKQPDYAVAQHPHRTDTYGGNGRFPIKGNIY
jgi:hypothetical protein